MKKPHALQLKPGQKGWALFYTPRCGSTPIARLLANRLIAAKRDCPVYLEEIFNPDFTGIRLENEKLAVDLNAWSKVGKKNTVSGRIALLKKSKQKHFFKFNSTHLTKSEFAWVAKNYKILFCERNDLFEQLLSFLISSQTNRWYSPKQNKIKDGSLIATSEDFVFFSKLIFSYEQIKKKHSSSPVFTYESFLSVDRKNAPGTPFPITVKQNSARKIRKFKNAGEIRGWYKNSFLDALAKERKLACG